MSQALTSILVRGLPYALKPLRRSTSFSMREYARAVNHISASRRLHPASFYGFAVPVTPGLAPEDSGPPASDGRVPTDRSPPTATSDRSLLVGMTVWSLGTLG